MTLSTTPVAVRTTTSPLAPRTSPAPPNATRPSMTSMRATRMGTLRARWAIGRALSIAPAPVRGSRGERVKGDLAPCLEVVADGTPLVGRRERPCQLVGLPDGDDAPG